MHAGLDQDLLKERKKDRDRETKRKTEPFCHYKNQTERRKRKKTTFETTTLSFFFKREKTKRNETDITMAQLINKVSVKKDMTSFKNVNVATTSNSKNYESDDDMDYGTNSTAINNFTSDVFRKFVKSNGDKRTIESDDYFYHDRRSSPGLFRPVSIDDHTEEVESDKQNAYNTLPTIHEYTENGPLLHIEGKDEGQQERPKNDAPMYLSTQHQVASGPSDTAVQQTFGTTANENFDNGDYRLGTNTPEFVGHGGDFQPAQDEAFSSPSTGLNVFGTPLPILNEFQNQHGQFQHSQYVIQTPHGPALLLGRDGGGGYGTGNAATAPNNNTLMSPLQVTHPNPHDVNAISSVPSIQVKPTASTNRKFQRWSDEEDQLLKDAVEREPGPPYNWRKIANLHFPSSRTSSQCKSRWTKV